MNRLSNYKEHHQSIGGFFPLHLLSFGWERENARHKWAAQSKKMKQTVRLRSQKRERERRRWTHKQKEQKPSTKINKISTIIISLKKMMRCNFLSLPFGRIDVCFSVFFSLVPLVLLIRRSPRIRIVMIFIRNLLILISLEAYRASIGLRSALAPLFNRKRERRKKTDRIIW